MQIFRSPARHRVVALLSSAGLPSADLPEDPLECFWGCGSPENPKGVIGLEVHGSYGLLRSLVVEAAQQKTGCAKALVSTLENYAHCRRLRSIFLLTETAEGFFGKLGYHAINRNIVPEPIRATQEFSSLCPSTAIVMTKRLDRES